MKKFLRSWWFAYALGSAAILLALGAVTQLFLELETSEREARAENEHQSRVQLALWRIDSWLGPIVALETARPFAEYAGTATSSLFDESPDFVLLHFQLEPSGTLCAPAPETTAGISHTSPHLNTVASLLDDPNLEERILTSERQRSATEPLASESAGTNVELADAVPDPIRAASSKRGLDNRDDLSRRQGVAQKLAKTQAQVANAYPSAAIRTEQNASLSPPPHVGTFQPLWFEGDDRTLPHLLFVRRVESGPSMVLQGFLCDWPKLRTELLDQVTDLVPDARLIPTFEELEDRESRPSLATLPAELAAPFDLNAISSAGSRPTRLLLALCWLTVVGGWAALGASLLSAARLAERRARFAVAVTHELRTPLTTFQMYTEMLTEGMVTDPKQRDQYIATLHDESGRLGRLVENVLAYSQLEEGRRAPKLETKSLRRLVDSVARTLSRRAQEAGLTIEYDFGQTGGVQVETDPDAISQILFNLVDNACKYAGDNRGQPISVSCHGSTSHPTIRVRDHGPGITPDTAERIFTAFERGEDVVDRPGIGLGLALSQALARGLGGDLRIVKVAGVGACFELSLDAG